jgi:hypothetical protein
MTIEMATALNTATVAVPMNDASHQTTRFVGPSGRIARNTRIARELPRRNIERLNAIFRGG